MERLSENAIAILNELHTERLDYNSEYVPLADALNKLAAYEDVEEQGRLAVAADMRIDKLIGAEERASNISAFGTWISVKDALPAHGGAVLVYGKNKYGRYEKFTAYLRNGTARWRTSDRIYEGRDSSEVESWEITHWMPLPEGPECGEGGRP